MKTVQGVTGQEVQAEHAACGPGVIEAVGHTAAGGVTQSCSGRLWYATFTETLDSLCPDMDRVEMANCSSALSATFQRQVDVQDFGPAIRLRDRPGAPANPHDVVVGLGTDPDSPETQVQRARRVVQYETMLERGTITAEQVEACERYLAVAGAAEGARARSLIPTGRLPAWMRGAPTERLVKATIDLRSARSAIGNNGRALMDLLVVENLLISAIAERRREDRKTTLGQVQATLTRLAEHWG